ncbi:RNA 2',3'-cyclic phosphodiesterase [Pseudomonas sp.]|uniref:RNA 2',3'-cyclic phosphodiesterase n=1 Tax=Pseudomonas sp. TaxID=306 RepID=UPI0019E49A04|nr:RNA 2',3'-cyclic phosphodiesterase [Pseudomonas sp.]MBF0673948.1 RNA 2',3'-cyclic phosphodiesterase [Pseudomonas sp.]
MNSPHLRLFFALPCPPQLAAQIATWRESLGIEGQPVMPADLHVTLAFLGQQPLDKLPLLERMAAGLQIARFHLQLDQLQQWHSGLLVLTPSQPPEALLHLQRELQRHLLAAGLPVDARPFRPHLTLLRRGHTSVVPAEPCFAWTAEEWGLLASEPRSVSSRYRLLQAWPLLRHSDS